MSGFDKYDNAGAYHWKECDRSSRDYNPPLVARYGAVVDAASGARCLEIGCGDGYLSHRLSERFKRVVGIEYERGGIALAGKFAQSTNCNFARGSGYQLPFVDTSFDCVVLADVIEHLDTPLACVNEARRVLAHGGKLLVTTPQWRPDRVWDPRHVTEYKPEELEELLRSAFDRVSMQYFWPRRWCDLYRTRLGWRALKLVGRLGYNPFTRSSGSPDGYCQMLAVCTKG